MKRMKQLVLLIVLYIVGTVCFSTPVNASEALSFSYKVNHPENQQSSDVGYFDLRMKEGQKQTVTIDLTNESDKEIPVTVSLNGAKTNGNGVIEYGPTAIDNDKSLKYDFADIVKAPEEITIPAKSTVPLNLDITMPATSYDGVISGGIQLKQKVDEKAKAKQSGVINEYAFLIGMILSETDTVVEPNLELNKVSAGLNNFRNSVFVNFSNVEPAYLEGLTMDVQISQKGSDAVLYDTKKADMRVAPNSLVDFPVSMNGEKMVPGDYKAHIVASTESKKWEWDEEFTITDEEADKYNKQDVDLTQEQGINWLIVGMIVGGVVLLVLIIFIIVRLMNKGKKKKSKKKK